jgi:small neutral amino acid transporter SnatA (MarC family)
MIIAALNVQSGALVVVLALNMILTKFCEEKRQNKSETSSLKILNMKLKLFKSPFQIPSDGI